MGHSSLLFCSTCMQPHSLDITSAQLHPVQSTDNYTVSASNDNTSFAFLHTTQLVTYISCLIALCGSVLKVLFPLVVIVYLYRWCWRPLEKERLLNPDEWIDAERRAKIDEKQMPRKQHETRQQTNSQGQSTSNSL